MALNFQPKPKTVVICDFAGCQEPEMVKKRPVVVLSAHKRNSKLVTVVPLSTTEPTRLEDYHHALSVNPLPDNPHLPCWAKCDMLMTVALHRLDRYKTVQNGVRTYVAPTMRAEDFQAVQAGVIAALGLGGVIKQKID